MAATNRRRALADHLIQQDDRADSRLITRLVVPILAQNFLGLFVGWTDTILAGRILGTEQYLAAGVVAGYLIWFIESLSALIQNGSQAIVARLLGARQTDAANHVVAQSLLMSVLLGLVLTVGVYAFADLGAGMMHLKGDSRAAVAEYLRVVAPACVPLMVLDVGTKCLRAAGHNWSATWIFMLVNAANIVVSWVLAVGLGPIPRLGWTGIAAGTATSFCIGGAATVWVLARGTADLRLHRVGWSPDLAVFRRVLRIGIPGAGSSLVIVICQLWFLSIIGRLGDTATAAHGVAIRCESMSWLFGEAMGMVATTLVGQSLGARRPILAERYGWKSFLISTAVLSAMGLFFLASADLLVAIFSRADASAVRVQGATALRLVALGMPALSASIVLTGALRGAGDTRGPLIYNTIGMLAFRVPLAYALTGGVVSLGLMGAWIAMVVDLYVRGILSLLRFRAGAWTRLDV